MALGQPVLRQHERLKQSHRPVRVQTGVIVRVDQLRVQKKVTVQRFLED